MIKVKEGQTYILNGCKFMCCKQLEKNVYAFTSTENFGDSNWYELTNQPEPEEDTESKFYHPVTDYKDYIHKPIHHEKVQGWYEKIKDIEANNYAWGPYLVSCEEAQDIYNEALKCATDNNMTWTGEYEGYGYAAGGYHAYIVEQGGCITSTEVTTQGSVAPSINIDTTKCELQGNTILYE